MMLSKHTMSNIILDPSLELMTINPKSFFLLLLVLLSSSSYPYPRKFTRVH